MPEFIIGALAIIGGSYASNILSALLGIGSLTILNLIIRKDIPNSERFCIISLIGLNPYFIIAST